MVLGVEFVCSVDRIKCFVNDVFIFVWVVFLLCILLIRMILGFVWRNVCNVFVKVKLILGLIWICCKFGCVILMGFFVVYIFFLGVFK